MKERPAPGVFSMHGVMALLVGAVLVPTLLSISVGIVALALWQNAQDIVLGVLVISFAAMVVGGSTGTLVLLRKYNRLARLQADFMANISHELNTPLTSIRMFAETLRYGRAQSPEEVKSCLAALYDETERLNGQIERILHWRRMEAGAMTYVRRPERIEDVVGDALRPLAALSLAQRTRIDLEAESGLPPVLVDRRAVAEALQNIVHNALKYGGDQAPVKVRLKGVEGGRAVRIEVLDRGPGIPKDERKHIFDRFYRGEQMRSDARLSGTGLGLSITRHVVQAHGGRLEVESHEGWGTRLFVTLPAAPIDPHGLSSQTAAEQGSQATASLLFPDQRAGQQAKAAGEEARPDEAVVRDVDAAG